MLLPSPLSSDEAHNFRWAKTRDSQRRKKVYDNNHLMSMKWLQKGRRSHIFFLLVSIQFFMFFFSLAFLNLPTSCACCVALMLANSMIRTASDVIRICALNVDLHRFEWTRKMLRHVSIGICKIIAKVNEPNRIADVNMLNLSLQSVIVVGSRIAEILSHQFYSFKLFTRNLFESWNNYFIVRKTLWPKPKSFCRRRTTKPSYIHSVVLFGRRYATSEQSSRLLVAAGCRLTSEK